jgi:hypothetical protein
LEHSNINLRAPSLPAPLIHHSVTVSVLPASTQVNSGLLPVPETVVPGHALVSTCGAPSTTAAFLAADSAIHMEGTSDPSGTASASKDGCLNACWAAPSSMQSHVLKGSCSHTLRGIDAAAQGLGCASKEAGAKCSLQQAATKQSAATASHTPSQASHADSSRSAASIGRPAWRVLLTDFGE